jgi:tripartite-type tricarboxylate transporter receptor subunit TctC
MQEFHSSRRDALRKLAGALAMLLPAFAAAPALADDAYPSKPIRLVVSYPPGGSNDIAARIIAPELGKALGGSVLVENRAGAGGLIGYQRLMKSEPDGYTLLLSSMSPIVLTPQTMKSPPFDTLKDFAAVNMFATTPEAIAVGPRLANVKTLKDLLDLAKKQQVTLSSSGTGGLPHLTIELLRKIQPNIMHVPYKAGAAVYVDIMGGQITSYFGNLGSAMGFISGGKVRPLAVTSAQRNPRLPDVPTMQEEGFPGFVITEWAGAYVPAGTPPAIVRRLSQAFQDAVKDPQVKAALEKAGVDVIGSSQADFQKFLKPEFARWAQLDKENNIRAASRYDGGAPGATAAALGARLFPGAARGSTWKTTTQEIE